MKSHLLHFAPLGVVVMPVLLVLASSMRDPKNPPTGQTGAPSETTCSTASGCHSGGNFSGTVALTGLPAELAPGTTYDLTLTLSSTCSRTGFEMTVLDKSNVKCGDLIAGTNNNLKTVGTRQYIRQSNANTLTGGKSSYTFKWKAPATIQQDTAIFYYVMLQANGNGNTSGDNVAKGVKKVAMATSSASDDVSAIPVTLFPNPVQQFLNIDLPPSNTYTLSLVNAQGRLIQTFSAIGPRVLDVSDLSSGQYLLRIKGKEGSTTKSFMITR